MWKCSCGTIRKQDIKVAYTNLISHIQQKHPNYLEVFNLAQQEDSLSEKSSFVTGNGTPLSVSGQTTLDDMFDTACTNVFKWLECIFMDDHELACCKKDLTRGNTKLDPISVKTLKKNLFKVAKAVKKVSAKAMFATCYSIVFDGWSEASKHFIGMNIVYPAKEYDADPVMNLFAFAWLQDETNFTAENHANFIEATLKWYSLSVDCLFVWLATIVPPTRQTQTALVSPSWDAKVTASIYLWNSTCKISWQLNRNWLVSSCQSCRH